VLSEVDGSSAVATLGATCLANNISKVRRPLSGVLGNKEDLQHDSQLIRFPPGETRWSWPSVSVEERIAG
jgi:hypothetical protein